MNKVRILFLAANPICTNQLKLDEEIRLITEKIRASKHRDSLQLISAWAVQADDLIQLLNEHKPQIVHFSGHGSSTGEIVLSGSEGTAKAISISSVKFFFSILKDNIRLVILNACYSELQARAVIENIDCAIGMNTAIGDTAAITFAASFYRAIGFGRSIQEAFNQGKLALMLEGIAEANTPEILVKESVNPAEVFLINQPLNSDKRTSSDEVLRSNALQSVDVLSLANNIYTASDDFNNYGNSSLYRWTQSQQQKISAPQNSYVHFLTEDVQLSQSQLDVRFTIYNNSAQIIKIYNFHTVEYSREQTIFFSGGPRPWIRISPNKPFIERDETFEIKSQDNTSFRLTFEIEDGPGAFLIIVGIFALYHMPTGKMEQLGSDKLYMLYPSQREVTIFNDQSLSSSGRWGEYLRKQLQDIWKRHTSITAPEGYITLY